MRRIQAFFLLLTLPTSFSLVICFEPINIGHSQNLVPRALYDYSNLTSNFDWEYYNALNNLNFSSFASALDHYQKYGFFNKLTYCKSFTVVITLSIANIDSLNDFIQKINHFMQINPNNLYYLKICIPSTSLFPGQLLDSSSQRERLAIIKNILPNQNKLTLKTVNNLYRIKEHIENNINLCSERIQYIFSEPFKNPKIFKTISFLRMLEQTIKQQIEHHFIIKLHDDNQAQERDILTSFINIPINTLLRTHDFLFSTTRIYNYNTTNTILTPLLEYLKLPPLSFTYSLENMFIASSSITNFFKDFNFDSFIAQCTNDQTKTDNFELLISYLIEYLHLKAHRITYTPWQFKSENAIVAPSYQISIKQEAIKQLIQEHSIKMMAIYFPQFHEFKENNKFWGKGFTEWTLMNRFIGEIKKPHVDIGQYNMLDIETRKKQALIAREHGISAFCYYHYWFKDEKIMHAGIEKILQDGEPNLPFLFCWANETWSRTWDGANQQVLIPQDYGTNDDWIKHYNYLSQFFKHPNYIKHNNCPIIYIYRLEHIIKQNAQEMFKLWKNLAKKDGFEGLKIISMLNGHDNIFHGVEEYIDGYVEHQPTYNMKLNGWSSLLANGTQNLLDAQKIYQEISTNPKIGSDYTRGVFYSWDHSSRRVNNSSFKFINTSYVKFKELLLKTIENIAAQPNNNENYILINSWNEWTEQAMIEPNNHDGYKLLDIIKELFG